MIHVNKDEFEGFWNLIVNLSKQDLPHLKAESFLFQIEYTLALPIIFRYNMPNLHDEPDHLTVGVSADWCAAVRQPCRIHLSSLPPLYL